MNILDIIFLIPMIYLTYRGYKNGIVKQIASLVGLIAGVWAATHLSQWVAEVLNLAGDWTLIAAFFITFVGALLLAHLLGKCVEGIMKAIKLGTINRLFGAVIGLVEAICVVGILVSYIAMFDHNQQVLTKKITEESLFYKPISQTGGELTEKIHTFISQHQQHKEAEK